MFATHALKAGELTGLNQPAIAFSSPREKSKEDGLLTMSEILGLSFPSDLVVLSACNTGAASSKNAEYLSGLSMSFFFSGAKSLLVTNWPVETSSALDLTTSFFKIYAANNQKRKSQILAEAQRKMINNYYFIDKKSGEKVFSYSHPIFLVSIFFNWAINTRKKVILVVN